MDPNCDCEILAPVQAPASVNPADVPPARKAAAPAAQQDVPSVPRAVSAKPPRLRVAAAATDAPLSHDLMTDGGLTQETNKTRVCRYSKALLTLGLCAGGWRKGQGRRLCTHSAGPFAINEDEEFFAPQHLSRIHPSPVSSACLTCTCQPWTPNATARVEVLAPVQAPANVNPAAAPPAKKAAAPAAQRDVPSVPRAVSAKPPRLRVAAAASDVPVFLCL
ncbi:uncharacterized protein LOC107648891 [Monodelphis domestica]|uniref:uncharacterized protein LOC107648891 n=1 Tax=Monodelphis domestica TaxID=13616 RepID=UPI0024E2600C|nr:uncharacterized protein LOC107648891 [Monodelphis domestica]